jgi:tRNA (guanine10-N2)-dimethyltransferase
MKVICELSGEHPDLPFAELELIGRVTARNPQVAVVEAPDPTLARRLSLTHNVLVWIAECDADRSSFAQMLESLSLSPEDPYVARVRKVAGSAMPVPVPELERIMGSKIRGRVCLENPPIEYRAIFSAGRCYLGRLLYRIDRGGFDRRRPGSREFFHPGVMMPRMARALVNISLVQEGEFLLDPFCGTGGIVLEAVMAGARGIGSDIDRDMVTGSRRNVPEADFVSADTTALPFPDSCFPAIVTDLPYGQSVSIVAGSLESLYRDALQELQRVLVPGRRAVVVTHRDISGYAGEILSIQAAYTQRVHRSLTRRILVLRK